MPSPSPEATSAPPAASELSPAPRPAPEHSPPAGATLGLSLAALGIVFGDIGTSPLYTLRECIHGEHRLAVSPLDKGFYRVIGHYGFMDTLNLPALIADAVRAAGLRVNLRQVTYFIGRETFPATASGRLGKWSESLFAFLSRNARSASSYFCLPPEQVMEIGAQIDL